jgi:type IV pilus assembly protein PilB
VKDAAAPRTSPPRRRRLGDLLVAEGLINADQLDAALEEQKRTGEKIGTALVASRAITEDQLVEFLARQHRVATFSRIGRRLGDLLLADGLITAAQLEAALVEQKRTGERVGAALVAAGAITEDHLVQFLANQYRVSVFSLADDEIDPAVVSLVPARIARDHEVLPIARTNSTLTLAMTDPTNISVIDEVAFITGLQVLTVLAPRSRLRQLIERCYEPAPLSLAEALTEAESGDVEIVEAEETAPVDLSALRAEAGDAPAVRVVNAILIDAIGRRASDVHLEPEERAFRVRFRVDGVLQPVMTPPKRLEAAILSRVKIMANLDIAEHRLPQNGRLKLRANRHEVDVRVSTMPTIFGESISLRILDKAALALDLARLGLEPVALAEFDKAIRAPAGLIIITGPTGAGKTTTLYSAVHALNQPGVKIITIEDPVEYHLQGIYQVEVNDGIGRTFASALRAALRHDPDVLLVGEIRDLETAQIAVRAALTGHLVLSTLHTIDAAAAIARLVDMGVPPFLLASTLRLLVAQRLVRRICPHCKERCPRTDDVSREVQDAMEGYDRTALYRGTGCPACEHTGTKGRVGIYEVMPVDQDVRELIQRNASTNEIRTLAQEHGMDTLRDLGVRKAREGVATLDEVLRITPR